MDFVTQVIWPGLVILDRLWMTCQVCWNGFLRVGPEDQVLVLWKFGNLEAWGILKWVLWWGGFSLVLSVWTGQEWCIGCIGMVFEGLWSEVWEFTFFMWLGFWCIMERDSSRWISRQGLGKVVESVWTYSKGHMEVIWGLGVRVWAVLRQMKIRGQKW